jgi:L,D-transpeptidase ErfK/SrfK
LAEIIAERVYLKSISTITIFYSSTNRVFGQMRPHAFKVFGLFLGSAFSLFSASAQALDLEVARLPGLSDPNAYLPLAVEPFKLELDLSERKLTVLRAGKTFKRYPVAVGRAGWETPKGTFKVKTMFKDPEWINPFTGELIPGGDPDNPLGRRWIGFWTDGKNWAGFHGTNSVSSIGTAASHGCVRMFEKDIEEVFETVPLGTPVVVKP